VTEPLKATTAEEWRGLLGRKVSIRYRISQPGAQFAEAIGVVMAVGGPDEGSDQVKIITRRGDVRVVEVGSVIAGKVWPVP
jgi:hypothetical protein